MSTVDKIVNHRSNDKYLGKVSCGMWASRGSWVRQVSFTLLMVTSLPLYSRSVREGPRAHIFVASIRISNGSPLELG